MQEQISEHSFREMDTIIIILLIFFATREVLKIGEYNSDIPQFKLENIQSRDAFEPIGRERKYLIDYKRGYRLVMEVDLKSVVALITTKTYKLIEHVNRLGKS